MASQASSALPVGLQPKTFELRFTLPPAFQKRAQKRFSFHSQFAKSPSSVGQAFTNTPTAHRLRCSCLDNAKTNATALATASWYSLIQGGNKQETRGRRQTGPCPPNSRSMLHFEAHFFCIPSYAPFVSCKPHPTGIIATVAIRRALVASGAKPSGGHWYHSSILLAWRLRRQDREKESLHQNPSLRRGGPQRKWERIIRTACDAFRCHRNRMPS
ncbi:unnamed protein product [Protopolystoma xenopodis]|uniref:Uncharacterized protein n=1 Tax=Protopolystoma xenopodis TaxID=117903 RepID=A0A448X502_9PLAT|nr:unnamed protein product [Protopolystoma xenopodis]